MTKEQDNININKPIIKSIYAIVNTDNSEDTFVSFVKNLVGIDTVLDKDVSVSDLANLMNLGDEDVSSNYSDRDIIKGVLHFITDLHCAPLTALFSQAKSVEAFSEFINNADDKTKKEYQNVVNGDDRIIDLEVYSDKPLNQRDGGLDIPENVLIQTLVNTKVMTMQDLYNKTKKTFGVVE